MINNLAKIVLAITIMSSDIPRFSQLLTFLKEENEILDLEISEWKKEAEENSKKRKLDSTYDVPGELEILKFENFKMKQEKTIHLNSFKEFLGKFGNLLQLVDKEVQKQIEEYKEMTMLLKMELERKNKEIKTCKALLEEEI